MTMLKALLIALAVALLSTGTALAVAGGPV
jgi:hypothetical protein